MMVPRPLAVQPADHRLARGHLEAGARRHHRGRERAATHLLAAGAVARHRQERRLRDAEAHLAAAAASFDRQRPFGHRLLLSKGGRYSAAAINRTGRSAVLSAARSEEHTSELQSLMRISYAV